MSLTLLSAASAPSIDLPQVIITLLLGALLGVVGDRILKRPMLRITLNGQTYEANGGDAHLVFAVANRPLLNYVKLPGDAASGLRASLAYTQQTSITVGGNTYPSGDVVYENHLAWGRKPAPASAKGQADEMTIQPGAHVNLMLFTKSIGSTPYRISGANTTISEPKRMFTLSIRGDGGVSISRLLIVENRSDSIEGLRVLIKKIPSANARKVRIKTRKAISILLGV